jgi:hypothetical protein
LIRNSNGSISEKSLKRCLSNDSQPPRGSRLYAMVPIPNNLTTVSGHSTRYSLQQMYQGHSEADMSGSLQFRVAGPNAGLMKPSRRGARPYIVTSGGNS